MRGSFPDDGADGWCARREAVCEPVPAGPKPPASQWSAILADPGEPPKPNRPKPAPVEAVVAVVVPKIVLNCPKCLKRYEIDGALAGKKSRCKDCGEIFTIPAPAGRPITREREPERPPPPPAPLPVPSYWESALDAEASQPAASRPTPRQVVEDEELPLPPRAPSPEKVRRTSSRREPIDSELGVTLAGFYTVFAVFLLIVFSVWYGYSEPSSVRLGAVFRLAYLGLLAIGWLLSFAGGIWLLVIAFREKLEQGILVLIVPCYALYYTISRWREARGTFALQMSFLIVTILFGFAQSYMFHLAPTIADIEAKLNTPNPGEEFAAAQGDEPNRPFGDQPAPPGMPFPPGFGGPAGPRGGFPGRPGPPPGFPTIRPGKAISFDDAVKEMLAKQGDRAVAVVNLAVPVNNDPTIGPTSRDVTDAISKRLKELAPNASSSMSIGVGNKWATFLSPVDDVRALARVINFGTVSVKGRRIDVQLSRDFMMAVPRLDTGPAVASRPPPAQKHEADPVIPADADPIAKSLIQLKSHNKGPREEAVRRLRRITPSDRKDEVVEALLPLLDDDDGFLVQDVLQALETWQSPKAVPALIHRTKDDRVFVRKRAIKTLGQYKDDRAIEPIADRLKEDGFEAKDALIRMGSMVEPAMIERLRDHDSKIRSMACQVLMYVGGIETLKAMKTIPPDPDVFVQGDARKAIQQIISRVGPLPKDGDSKKATNTAPKKRKQS